MRSDFSVKPQKIFFRNTYGSTKSYMTSCLLDCELGHKKLRVGVSHGTFQDREINLVAVNVPASTDGVRPRGAYRVETVLAI